MGETFAASPKAEARRTERRSRARDFWASTPYTAIHHPWTDPPEVTEETQALADAIDAGGAELIAATEG